MKPELIINLFQKVPHLEVPDFWLDSVTLIPDCYVPVYYILGWYFVMYIFSMCNLSVCFTLKHW